MRNLTGIFMGSVFVTFAAASHAESDFCGKNYSVVSGDTLSGLAHRAFGDSNAFMLFYDNPLNAEVLGSNPNFISIGDQIALPPCDGAVVETEAPSRTVNVSNEEIDVLTGSNNYPFTGEDLAEGGLLSQVVKESFDSSDIDNPVKIDFINDWSSHLDTLLPKGVYDLAFPWFKPQCDQLETLNEEAKKRCELVWSDSLFSVAIGFYIPESLENPPLTFADLKGKRICRPEGNFLYDLENNGLVDGQTIALIQPATAKDCFEQLERGEVYAVSVNRFTADLALAETGLSDLVIPSGIVSTQTMHMVAEPDNADAVKWVEEFNIGLAKLRESGRYLQIVNAHFGAHNALTE